MLQFERRPPAYKENGSVAQQAFPCKQVLQWTMRCQSKMANLRSLPVVAQ
jgi:hypothetical protein